MHAINTPTAPAPNGTYSQAIVIDTKNMNKLIFIAGQIPKNTDTGEIITGNFAAEVKQVFDNIRALAKAAGGDLRDIVKLTVFLTDLSLFNDVNAIMETLFIKPYPARSTIQVSRLPADVRVEIEAIMAI